MAVEIVMPRVDMDMTTGKLTQWFVAEGERVEQGQPLFEIETDKAAMEIEAGASGILRAVAAKPGDRLPVGTVIGVIAAPGEEYAAPERAPALAAVAPAPEAAAPIAMPLEISSPSSDGLRATPAARRLARERGVDLGGLAGSGPNGRIQAGDVGAGAEGAALNRLWLARGRGTPLVFLHGFGADLNGWRPLVGRLRGERPFLALDLPGHGASALSGAVSLEAFVAAVDATLVKEGVGELHLVGHSLGGAVAVALAERRGERARSLTLIAPAGLGPEVNGDFLAGFLRAQSESSLAPWMRLLAHDEGALGSAMVKTTLRQRRESDIGAAQSAIAAALFPDGVQAFDVRAALARYAGPAKVIFGLDDRIIPPRQARGLPGLLALHMFPGVGHMPHFEARAAIARLIEENVAAGES
ncbi:MAG: acetoin dehydrogenase dihydrolipoyllysine-residue acetyltransferase subunit [Hyphomicrobiales bacterium]|nr:acetoin dehydrogenase dihydrolipoyllysine-residue acetyltransferase subunit [Hyphomicrobiales bacterium]